MKLPTEDLPEEAREILEAIEEAFVDLAEIFGEENARAMVVALLHLSKIELPGKEAIQ